MPTARVVGSVHGYSTRPATSYHKNKRPCRRCGREVVRNVSIEREPDFLCADCVYLARLDHKIAEGRTSHDVLERKFQNKSGHCKGARHGGCSGEGTWKEDGSPCPCPCYCHRQDGVPRSQERSTR